MRLTPNLYVVAVASVGVGRAGVLLWTRKRARRRLPRRVTRARAWAPSLARARTAIWVLATRGRVARRLDRQVPLALDALAAGLRTGMSLTMALAEARERVPRPLRGELDRIVADMRGGASASEALHAWPRRRPSAAVALTATALIVAIDVGGAEARTIERVAATLRDRLAVDREVAALSSQARSSAAVVMCAPLLFTLVTGVGDDSSIAFLVQSPVGWGCLALGALLDGAGGWWMWRVTRGSVG